MTPAKAHAPGSPVYCSGPMFSDADKYQLKEIADALKAGGFSTYVPRDNGIEVARVMDRINLPLFKRPQDVLEVTQFVRKLVFALDVFQLLERCGAVVFNLDGRVPDDGSVMEAALGWTANRPVVLFKTTPVTMLGGYDNPMVTGLGLRWAYVSKVRDLARAVATAVAADASLEGQPFVPGPHAAAVVALGSAVWKLMPTIRQISQQDDPRNILPAVRKLERNLRPLLVAADLA